MRTARVQSRHRWLGSFLDVSNVLNVFYSVSDHSLQDREAASVDSAFVSLSLTPLRRSSVAAAAFLLVKKDPMQ